MARCIGVSLTSAYGLYTEMLSHRSVLVRVLFCMSGHVTDVLDSNKLNVQLSSRLVSFGCWHVHIPTVYCV